MISGLSRTKEKCRKTLSTLTTTYVVRDHVEKKEKEKRKSMANGSWHQHQLTKANYQMTNLGSKGRQEVLPTMLLGESTPGRHSCAPPCWSHLGTEASQAYGKPKPNWRHSCSGTLCRSSPRVHGPDSLR